MALLVILLPFGETVRGQETSETGMEVYNEHSDAITRKIDEAVVLYKNGDGEEAYDVALSAYLDHFEFLEPYIRPQHPDAVLRWESEFLEFRKMIKERSPQSAVQRQAQELKDGIQYDIRAKFEGTSIVSQSGAAVLSGSIIFREGIEVVLLIGIFLTYLHNYGRLHLRKYLVYGVAGGLTAALGTWFVFAFLIGMSGWVGEVIELGAALLAVAFLFYSTLWFLSRPDEERVVEFVKADTWRVVKEGKGLLLGLIAFVAVYRDGFEAVIFYQAIFSIYPQELSSWLFFGFVIGLALVAVIGLPVYALGVRLPLRWFLVTAVIVAASLSVFFTGSVVKELQILGYLPHTPLPSLPQLNATLADLVGYRRTLETIVAQGSVVFVYAVGGVYGLMKTEVV